MTPECSTVWITFIALIVSPLQFDNIFGNLGLQLVESFSDFQCPRISNCTCYDGNYVELHCPIEGKIITIIYSPDKYVSLICKHHTATSYIHLPVLDLGPSTYVKTFSFKNCPFPSSSLVDVINRAGITKLNKLMFQTFEKNLKNKLHKSHFKGLGGVSRLQLPNNGLTDLPDDLFEDMFNLTELELRTNKIRIINDVFTPLVNLEILHLAENELSNLPDGVFSHSKHLKTLNLWKNNFIEIHTEAFEGLYNLMELDLSSNLITTFPEDIFSSLINLKVINLSNNNFSSLPANLFTCNKNLAKIRLCNNRQKLKILPDNFLRDLPKLEEVYLYDSELEIIPETIFKNSTEIRNISLNNNNISIIPPYLFYDQKNLLTLNLNSNQITFIPDEAFETLINLEQLNLDDNAISNISRGLFSKMHNLKVLTMQNNQLLHIHDDAFEEMKNLNYVNMAYNQLKFHVAIISCSPFQHLHDAGTLTHLNLSNNNITEITFDWRTYLWKLSKLDLSYNKIEKFKFNDVYFRSDSIEIDLRNNNISEIDFGDHATQSVTYNKGKIGSNNGVTKPNRIVFIDGNPLKCDCRLVEFVRYLRSEIDPRILESVTIIPERTTCASPSRLRGTLLTKLLPQELICSLDHPVIGEQCPEYCTCYVRTYDFALIINCSNSRVNEIPTLMNITTFVSYHTELHMEGNHMKLLTKNVNYVNINDANVTKLFVANNNITDITFFGLSKHIEVLDLRNNTIKNMNSSVVNMLNNSMSLKELWLSGNPIECECRNIELLLFIQYNYKKIMDFPAVKCSDGSQVANLTIGILCAAPPVVIAVTVLLAIVCLTLGVTVALYYKYNHEIKVFLFSKGWCLFWLEEEELDKDKIYDAFISFSHKDENFVVNQLMPELEKKPDPLKICIHFRDWIPGEYIPTQIIRSVEESRRTIVVLSPDFLESVWGKMEFRTAHCNALKEGRARVIVIVYGDIGATDKLDPELRTYLKMNTYVKWGDPWFWHNLKYALPHPSSRKSLIANPADRQRHFNEKIELISDPTTPPAQNTPPANLVHTNPLIEHVNNIPSGEFQYPNVINSAMISKSSLKT